MLLQFSGTSLVLGNGALSQPLCFIEGFFIGPGYDVYVSVFYLTS